MLFRMNAINNYVLVVLSSVSPPSHMFFCKSSLQRWKQMNELPCNKPVLEIKMRFLTAVCCPSMALNCLNWQGME